MQPKWMDSPLPREFISVYIVAVYITLDANSNNALQELCDVIIGNMTKQQMELLL